jgi:hypothetical protein
MVPPLLSISCNIVADDLAMMAYMQWRTLPIIVGGAKSHYIKVEGANLKYFIFYMVKTYKY